MSLPEHWQEVLSFLLAPIAWVPRLQETLIAFFLDSSSGWGVAAKYLFLLFPVLVGLAAMWLTLLSLYTLPFRSGRVRFVSLMLLAWWDAARAVWFYWVGVLRCAAVAAGWVVSLTSLVVRLILDAVRQVATMPFMMTGRRRPADSPPGVPRVACGMLLLWCALEAGVFTYTVSPTVTGVVNDIVGAGETAPFTAPVLYVVLLLLIAGSFACLQALVDAVRKRERRFLAQAVVVQGFVMFFEVMFLYREVVGAITPWIVRETGVPMGLWPTLAMAGFGWVGTRAMTWYLFAQYSVAPLLAFISCRPRGEAEAPDLGADATIAPMASWRGPLQDFTREVEWLHARGDELQEYLVLPVLQLLAAALNFGMVMVASRLVFPLPFKTLKEVTDTRDIIATIHLRPGEQAML